MSNISETRQLLIDTAERIFSDHCNKAALDAAERGEFPATLWQTLRENGFHELALASSGVPLGDTFAVLQVAARHAVPLPLTEILLANRWLDSGAQLATVGLLSGATITDAPWARAADVVLGIDVDTGELVQQARTAADVASGSNMAGEARDRVTVAPGATRSVQSEPAFELIALGRAVSISGTLQRILTLTLQYANEREQFGRSISKFQAIQHNLAVMAGEVAAASRAADAAIDALGTDRFGLEVAAAKARIGEAGLDRRIAFAKPDCAKATKTAATQCDARRIKDRFVAGFDPVAGDRLDLFNVERAGGRDARAGGAAAQLGDCEKGGARQRTFRRQARSASSQSSGRPRSGRSIVSGWVSSGGCGSRRCRTSRAARSSGNPVTSIGPAMNRGPSTTSRAIMSTPSARGSTATLTCGSENPAVSRATVARRRSEAR